MIWQYISGKWNKLKHEDLQLSDQQEGELYEDYLKRNGFDEDASLSEGPEWAMFYTMHKNSERDSWLVNLSICYDCHEVYIEDLPSLLQFLKEYKQLFILPQSDFVTYGLRDHVRKDVLRTLSVVKEKEGVYKVIGKDEHGNQYDLLTGETSKYLRREFNLE